MMYQTNPTVDPAILPTPINETEVSLIRVFNEPKLSTLAKMRFNPHLAFKGSHKLSGSNQIRLTPYKLGA